ncbi:hypothetical protein Tco_1491758 [Tanacetum coccineum]
MSTQPDINAIRAQRLANTHDPLALMANIQTPFHPDQSSHITYIQHPQPNNNFVLQPSFNTNYMKQLMQNPKDISDPKTALDMALELIQIAQSGMKIDQDRHMLMVDDNVGNQFRENAVQNVGHLVGQNAVQNQDTHNVGNQNGLNKVLQLQRRGSLCQQLHSKAKEKGCAYDEIEKVTTNCNLQDNMQQASTSGTQSDKAPIYDSDGSAEVHHSENCYDNDIFNMLTQGEQYIELLEPIPEPHQIQQNDSNVISAVSSVEQSGGTVEQHPANVEETRVLYDSLYNNLAIEVEKVNSVNRKLRETNVDLTSELARYKNQEKYFEISQEKYDKLERCYKKSVYQEQCLTKKINALHLSSEKKKLKSDFKIREDELLDKQIQLENKINELDNILVKTGQSIQTMHMLSPKPDSFYHTEQKMVLGYQNSFYLKQAHQKQQSLYNGKVLLEKHDPLIVYDSEETLQLAQESHLKMKQLNKEIKPANYTKINHHSGVFVSQTAKSRKEFYFSNTSKMANVSKSISIPNEEFSDDTTPKATKFVRDFQSLVKEIDESLAKHKALELKIERLLRAIVSQDIISIMQCNSLVDTSNLQTELERTKERFENCIIKKENEYAKLWNDWYKKCEECKYDKISYDKAYNDMQQKIERLQAQLGDLKGKSKDTSCVSEQKDTTKGTSVNTLFRKQSILGKPPSSSKPKLYSVTPFPKSTVIPKVGKSNALSKPVTSNSAPSSRESTVVNNERVISLGIFRINPFKDSRVDIFVPNKHVKASVRTKPITVSQPHVITKNDVNSKTNGFSPKDVKSTTRTRRPQPRNNPKSDKVPFKSKSSCLSNKLEKIEENHRSLQSSNYPDHTSSECNNIKLAIRNEKSEVICATCKQCLITANHDECVLQYVNGMKSRKKNQSANVSKSANQRKHKPRVWKPKKVGSKERLASPKPSTPRSCLRWSPTGRMFDLKGKIITTSESECQRDCSKSDNACTSNPQEPINKRFPSSTFSMTGCQNWLDTLLIP